MTTPPTSEQRPQALTLRAAWERAGISRSTLYREITAGRIKTITVHKRASTQQLIEPAELDRWIAENRPYNVNDEPAGATWHQEKAEE